MMLRWQLGWAHRSCCIGADSLASVANIPRKLRVWEGVSKPTFHAGSFPEHNFCLGALYRIRWLILLSSASISTVFTRACVCSTTIMVVTSCTYVNREELFVLSIILTSCGRVRPGRKSFRITTCFPPEDRQLCWMWIIDSPRDNCQHLWKVRLCAYRENDDPENVPLTHHRCCSWIYLSRLMDIQLDSVNVVSTYFRWPFPLSGLSPECNTRPLLARSRNYQSSMLDNRAHVCLLGCFTWVQRHFQNARVRSFPAFAKADQNQPPNVWRSCWRFCLHIYMTRLNQTNPCYVFQPGWALLIANSIPSVW